MNTIQNLSRSEMKNIMAGHTTNGDPCWAPSVPSIIGAIVWLVNYSVCRITNNEGVTEDYYDYEAFTEPVENIA